MWLIAKGRLVSRLTTSMSRLTAAVVRKSDKMPHSPPSWDTSAAISADVQAPIGARMSGTSIPNRSQRDVFSIARLRARLEREYPRVRRAQLVVLAAPEKDGAQ